MAIQTVKPVDVPTKRLASNVTPASTSFQLSDILGWDGVTPLTAAFFGQVAYGAFRDTNGTVLELFSFDPATIASGNINFVTRGYAFDGSRTSEVTANKLQWVKGTTLVELGTDFPMLFQYLKDYVDTAVVGGGVPATTSVAGISKASVAPIDPANPVFAGDNDPRLFPNAYGVDAGSTDSYAITLTTAPAAYVTGQVYAFKANTANTGPATLNVNALGAKNILAADGVTGLADSQIIAGDIVEVIYDGTNFRLFKTASSVATDYQAFTASGTWTKPSNTTGNEMVLIQVWGAGGGGGTHTGGNSGNGGGGGGAFSELRIRSGLLGSTETVTVAAASAANAAGGSSSFGAWLSAFGGGGGAGGSTGTAGYSGGAGGGIASAGTSATSSSGVTGGGPAGAAIATEAGGFNGSGSASTAGNSNGVSGSDAVFGGASGGSGAGSGASNAGNGGNSVYGGAGGGGGFSSFGSGQGTGGTSKYGGAGGAGNGAAGTAPAGGGGGGSFSGTTTGGAGGRGEVRVWVIRS